MKNFRNIAMLGILAIFFAWYGLSWAYTTLYKEPRQRLGTKIAQYRQGIESGKQNIAMMQQVIGRNQTYYYRSLPRVRNDAKSLYSFWLLELLKFCDIEGADVGSDNPTQTAFGGFNYRFHVRGTLTLDKLSRLLFEFAYAPFLHRVTTISIAPVEGKEEQITVSLTIDALAIPPAFPQNPYPLANKLPTGHFKRLAANDLTPYRVIAERNLLQAARGGVDRADHAYLTAINIVNDEPELWISVRTDGSLVKAKQGESVRIGSFRADVIEIFEQDVVFQRDSMRWLVTLGDCLNEAFPLPLETY